MNHVTEKMYYNGREIVLQENKHENKYEHTVDNILCHGCVLESERSCVRSISPPQSNNVCCPRSTGVFYIFKYAQDERIAEEE